MANTETQTKKETVILTDFEMESVNSVRNRAQQIFLQLGQISIERKNRMLELDKYEESLLEQYVSLGEEENTLFETLREKYGDGTINPSTGEFIQN